MAKFFFFEKIVSLFYTKVFTAPRETYDKTTQLGITFASGYAAGVVCAVVSHPADSLVSLQGKADNRGKTLGQIASETGAKALFTKGLGTRVFMIGESRRVFALLVSGLTDMRRYAHWLPVVDLRHLQVVDGPRHVGRQVKGGSRGHLLDYTSLCRSRSFSIIERVSLHCHPNDEERAMTESGVPEARSFVRFGVSVRHKCFFAHSTMPGR
jgi:hypothetical protein